MSIKDEISWFKQNFSADILPAIAGTPLSLDLICALGYQETGELWSKMRHNLPRDEIIRLCVGDTLDTPNRSAFPKNRAALEAVQHGNAMFQLAHSLLGDMADATGIEAYKNVATKPNKFVHGYGVFQYDLQFFTVDPDYFLGQKWADIDLCIGKMMEELKKAVSALGFAGKTSLTDLESAFVAIVYNTGFGNFRKEKGLEQGFFDGTHFYGENIDQYIKIARSVDDAVLVEAVVPVADIQPQTAHASTLPEGTTQTPQISRIVEIARREFAKFGGIDEGKEPLRSHIADYYEAGNGSRKLDPTKDENAWSAAFISYCLRTAGVKQSQFQFDLSHSVYVKAAIQNQLNNRGVFRGRRISDYAPKIGDIIHHNRSGGTKTYDFAAENSGYPSHCAIVVDFEVSAGHKFAVTIGGNESIAVGTGTVGQKRFPLLVNGKLDQSQISKKLICVIENRLGEAHFDVVQTLGAHVVNVRTDLKLRGGPGIGFEVLRPLGNGTHLNVLSYENNTSGTWALVDLEGDGIKDGFVIAKFLDLA
jgi:hypothetical protein